MKRRDLLLGLGCVAALAGAESLRPRTIVSLLGRRKLSDVLPVSFAGWAAEGGGDIIQPIVPGSLADTLYNETVARTYHHRDGGFPVMLLAAHGDSQSDLLQLHRPESCYEAVGFAVEERRAAPIPVGPGAVLPGVALNARVGTRNEDVLYWTRLGEYLPTTAGEQRRDRLRTAMNGFVADGVLVRASIARNGGVADWARLNDFMAAMIAAAPRDARAALIGTGLARASA